MVTMIIAAPNTARTTPVARLRVFAVALFANKAAILAPRKVAITHTSRAPKSGFPSMTKCETAPVRAVKVIMKTLVPTAVLSS